MDQFGRNGHNILDKIVCMWDMNHHIDITINTIKFKRNLIIIYTCIIERISNLVQGVEEIV